MSDVIYNISSGFFDSVNGDRLYSAADMNKPYKRVIADGIFPTPQGTPSTDFQVVAVSGMSVAVLAGNAMIGARWAENADDVGITIAGNSSSSPRIDSIFLHIDTGMDTRAAGVVYRQGTAAGTPTAPAMVQTDNITELRLADILVAPSAAIITQANITDQRGGSDCPWVAGLIQQVDTSALFEQYRAAYAEQQQDQADEWNTFMAHLARDYDISMSLRKHESTYTSTAAASLIPINIDGYDTTKDLLQVFINGIFAVEGTHYIVKSAAQIQLTNAISAGQNVHFVIYKAVMGGAQPIIPTDEQVQDAVDAYMDAHPGALVVDPELSDTSTHAIQNKAVTEALAGVNGRLDELSLHPVKNLVTELLPLSTNQVLAGRTVTLSEVDVQRATAVVDVEGGKTYTVNQTMSNNFSGFADADDKWIGQVNNYKTADYIFTAPANAKKLYLCNTGWTVNQGLVVLEGDTPIAGTTKTEYPFDTVVRLEPSVPIEPYSTNVENLLTDTGFLKTQMDAQGVTFGGTIPGFSGNASTDDPLVVTVSRIYYKTKKSTGDMYLSSDALKNLTFTIGNNNALVFDYDTLTAYVTENLSAATYPLTNKFILIWKQGQAIKGDWAWLYYRQDIRTDALEIKRSIKRVDLYDKGITRRIHSRQGEGFTYPDNSLEGIKSALKDGYPGIRIAVASTSDDVIYCTHSYELRNNKTLNLNYVTVKATGNVYDGDVRINTVTSDFINTLQYKGYDIPTLESVLDYVCRFDVNLTLEVKDRMTATAVQNMLNACAYSGVNPVFSCDRYSAEDFVAVKQDADFEIQLNPYSAENAETYYNLYKDSCKSLRFGFVYNGTMPTRSEVVHYHNLGVTFRLAGSNPTKAQFEDVVRWADIIEVPGEYQTWIDRLINETW